MSAARVEREGEVIDVITSGPRLFKNINIIYGTIQGYDVTIEPMRDGFLLRVDGYRRPALYHWDEKPPYNKVVLDDGRTITANSLDVSRHRYRERKQSHRLFEDF